ncbi:MAG TPA: MATE family efflux transporter [Polyangia bacterium]|nr:MATE family efflux transporter [Polyangia bacterium]
MSTSPIEHDESARPQPAPVAADEGFWPLVREALAGSRRDLTAVPLARAILLLAVPMVLEMVMESIFAVADIFWVSKLGADAVAAVGLTESLLTVVYAVGMGMAMGVGAVVARRTGAKDPDGASRAAAQAIFIGLGLAAVIGTAGAIFGPALLTVMGASPAVVAVGARYAQLMLVGDVSIMLLFLINAAFRGAGDAAITMRALWLANGINILLGPLFVFGLGPFPRLGVTGAAVATTIGRSVGVLFLLRALARGKGRLSVRRAQLRIEPETMKTIFRLAKNGVVQTLIGFTSWIGLVKILAAFGSVPLAGYTIAMRVVMFALLPSWGLGNAAATLVGQNLGAGDPARAEAAVWKAAFYNFIFLGAVGVLLVVAGDGVVRLFTADPAIVAQGGRCLRIVAAGFAFYAYGMVVTQAFNGAGDTKTPTRINLACFWLGEIPLAMVLARGLALGPTGAYVAIAVAFSAVAVVSIALFRRGNWKSVKV